MAIPARYQQNKLKTTWARIRYFLALLKVKASGSTDPIMSCLIVNNKCNFKCKYCFGSYGHSKTPDYTTEELKGLIDDLYAMGVRYMNIHGGETLLRRDIGEIVDHIKGKGMYCGLITNGSLLQKRIDEIINVDNITISLDGRRENNDLNRGKGTYDKALSAIKLTIKEKIPLRVSATITKHTMNDVGYLAKLAKELGFTIYFSILFKPLPQAKDCEMTDAEIREAISQVIEYKRKGYPVFTSNIAAEYARDWPLDHNKYHYLKKKDLDKLPKDFKPIKCCYGKNQISIEGDGNVYPCFLLADKDKFKPLNWREVGIREAYKHVQETNDCLTCPAMSQNDHSLLVGLNLNQIKMVIMNQLKESFKRN